jgi:uncharacterized protein
MMRRPTMERQAERRPATPRIAEKVRFLSGPASYPHRPDRVEVVQTHMSWVFLADDLVFKLKKPVRTPFLDFSSLEARERNCRSELRLNRRLAPDIYLAVVPLTRMSDGRLALDGTGEPVDWLVKMRRLPADRMLDEAIRSGTASRPAIADVAELLAGFYTSVDRPAVDPDFLWRAQRREHAENRRILGDVSLGLPPNRVGAVLDAMAAALAEARPALRRRALDGWVVDGHGDLRPEHVCLTEPPVIIDCLEFNSELRSLDPFDELAFLDLDCERLGAAWIGGLIIERCADALGSSPPHELFCLYRAGRALLRARLALAHLLDAEPRTPEKWKPLALDYVAIAEAALANRSRPEARRSSRRH